MNKEKLLQDMKMLTEMDPDKHDGSYEIMREIVNSYAVMTDYSNCDYNDLNAIYLMAVGTWKLNPEKKKESILKTHLPQSEKERMIQVLDRVWDNACRNLYQNRVGDKPSVGMFGTGFYSFQNMTDDTKVQLFIKMLLDIKDMADENAIFDRAAETLNPGIVGVGAAAGSVILHCFKPTVFPILNGNMGKGNIYEVFGIGLKRPSRIETYIYNCKLIKEFRDNNFNFKNYRILDQWVRKIDQYQDEAYFPRLSEYDPGIGREQYEEWLQNESVVKKSSLDTLYYLYKLGGEASCTSIADTYGNVPQHYNANATYVGECIHKQSGCELYKRNEEYGSGYWAILFQGRYANKEEGGQFIWRLRKPLADAISTLDEANFFEGLSMNKVKDTNFDHNIILYGPPGTGKTYHTAYYAVAICENIPIEEVIKKDYSEIKKKYDEYRKQKRIDFVTFHQSYGYEEFIEGIRPIMQDDTDEDAATNDLKYEIKAGSFKRFCDYARDRYAGETDDDWGLNENPIVWKVSLEGTGENETRTECMNNDHIRIGWDEYGEDITQEAVYERGGKSVLNSFYNRMNIGDIVVSCYSSQETDAIGVVTGDAEWNPAYEKFKRVRKVKWLVKGIRENIRSINHNKPMVLASVYKLNVSLQDIRNIVRKYVDTSSKIREKNNYVFIIDEINRGNISKIFGELITLIEESKREGRDEAMTEKLAYSGDEFSVPDNVYILGTMNTADRSIALMDTALRRRFQFVEMMPNPSVLKDLIIRENGDFLDVSEMLVIINKRIEFLYDREHTIGHAFFTPLLDKENATISDLGRIFKKSIIPLLQEYFYEDYEKIRLVLGDNAKKDKETEFVVSEDADTDLFRGVVTEEDYKDSIYKINDKAFSNIWSYKGISEKL